MHVHSHAIKHAQKHERRQEHQHAHQQVRQTDVASKYANIDIAKNTAARRNTAARTSPRTPPVQEPRRHAYQQVRHVAKNTATYKNPATRISKYVTSRAVSFFLI